ncbi:MAG: HAMP domain-containing sensor histidine kinase [Sulfurimonas sp.]|jgi:C4-dicarboxylate-specific signal transduction histidine kinase
MVEKVLLETKDKTVEYIETFLSDDYATLKTNLNILLQDYKRKSHRLDKIIKQSDKQQLQMMELNEELDVHKNNLEIRVEEEIKKREEKEKMLFQQSRLAAMGEIIDAVAHQWKQPISIMSMQVEMMGYDFKYGLVNEKYVEEFQAKVTNQIEHMMSTLNEFRTFFRPAKDAEDFDVKKMIDKVLLLIKDEFIKNTIEIEVNETQNFILNGIENEFKHLIINIINNSKDAFNEHDTKNRKIIINILNDEKYQSIEILDNAGGIPENIINDIFKANVTTKAEGKGTGIGLYMSSQIAQKHHGTLSVENSGNGAKFIFMKQK